ncbi:hypothetical protein V8C26DRAFT_275586 [Trichoderma gracile]
MAVAQNIVDRLIRTARTQGLDHPYLCQNYASYQQDVFASYGKENLAKLKSISAKYVIIPGEVSNNHSRDTPSYSNRATEDNAQRKTLQV